MYISIGKVVIGVGNKFSIGLRISSIGIFLDLGFISIDYWKRGY